jgi:regulator of protease activity HflC (stomatin/prohibitin superfamily)
MNLYLRAVAAVFFIIAALIIVPMLVSTRSDAAVGLGGAILAALFPVLFYLLLPVAKAALNWLKKVTSKPDVGKPLVLALLVLLVAACSKVPAGNVGVKVYLLGGSKGVDVEELTPGRYWVGINEELYLFPTFTQNYEWTMDSREGSETDESFTFQTVEGLAVNADIGITYRIDPSKATLLFQTYRRGVDEITDQYLHNMVRDALVTKSSTLPVESVYGRGKAALIDSVQAQVREQVAPLGINVERVYWLGELRLPKNVLAALNAKIEATQMAQRRQNEVAQAKAEAEKAVEQARGEADAKLLAARAEAEAIRIKGEALSQNPRLVELSAIERWNGVLPNYMLGDSVPFVQLPAAK